MSKKSCIGIYFSDNFVNIVEQQDGKVFNFVKAPCVLDSIQDANGQTVVEETRIVNLIKSELLKNNIITRDVVLALLNKEVIVRFFDIPLVSQSEIESTVGFEIKKYIPFKLDKLVFDFQVKVDKKAKKINILFVGIKTETLDKYISVLEQAELKIVAIEPAFISTLRVLKLANKIDAKGASAVVDIHDHLDRGDITIVDNLYPRFSRDLNLNAPREGQDADEGPRKDMLPKLINEIKISLDYCRRRQAAARPLKINKLILLSVDDKNEWVEQLHSALEIPVTTVSIQKNISSQKEGFDLELSQAYGVSLRGVVGFPLNIDLFSRANLSAEEDDYSDEVSVMRRLNSQLDRNFLAGNIIVFFVLIFAVHLFGLRQSMVYNDKLKSLKINRRPVAALDVNAVSYDKLKEAEKDYAQKISVLSNLDKRRDYFAPKLSAIAALRPEGLWLTQIDYSQKANDRRELILSGLVYLRDEQKEFSAVNGFLTSLQKNSAFSGFSGISLLSMSRKKVRKYDLTGFRIRCR
ncbi:MAG: pilus assembly protein PilM [Candidatus Omnitrophota bacterium]